MNLGEASKGRNNNLDLIRFIAAALVILCHAYPISLGKEHVDFLGQITGNQIHLGNFAVCIFFLYGGYLIAKSAERLQTTGAYFKARIFRILPCLVVVTFLLAFVAGPVLTEEKLGDYFTNSMTYRYLFNAVMLPVHNLPGVFEHNIYDPTVNGPLWTLPIEFLCYIMCFLVLKAGFLNQKRMKWTIPVFAIGYLGAWFVLRGNEALVAALRPAGMFYTGMLYYVYRDKINVKLSGALVSLIALVLSAWAGILGITIFLFLPYVLFYIGYGTRHKFSNFAKYGEVSYGMYLCGWPIQQIVCMMNGGSMTPFLNFIITLPIAVICGFVLNKLVEAPIGRWMKKTA